MNKKVKQQRFLKYNFYGFHTQQKLILGHYSLRPGSGSGSGSDQKGPDLEPQHCFKVIILILPFCIPVYE
jgi:hypothetical protein